MSRACFEYAPAQRHPDRAVEQLARAVEAGFTNHEQFLVDPDFDSVKSDPRFVELVETRQGEPDRT